MKRSLLTHSLLCAALLAGQAWAQSPALPAGAFATVNGVALSQSALDKVLQLNLERGQKDTPQLRQALRTELIARELMVQEANRRGLGQSPAAQEAWAALQQNFLIDLLVSDHLAQNPLSEADLRAEYARQTGLLQDAQQYQLRHIVLASESEAKAVLSGLKKGQDFTRLAREKSIDASRDQGGNLGWLTSTDLVPPVARAVAAAKKNGLLGAPVEVDGRWHLVQIDERRPFQVPRFEDALPQLRQALAQQRRMQLLDQLAKAARIQP